MLPKFGSTPLLSGLTPFQRPPYLTGGVATSDNPTGGCWTRHTLHSLMRGLIPVLAELTFMSK